MQRILPTDEDRIRAKLEKIHGLGGSTTESNRCSREFAIQTMPDLGELAVQTESQLTGALSPRRTADSQVGSSHSNLETSSIGTQVKRAVIDSQMTVQGQIKVYVNHVNVLYGY